MSDEQYQEIKYNTDGPVAQITLNRPDSLNAWTEGMDNEVRLALGRAEADPEVVGIVITGEGRAFCAGADLGLLDQIIQTGELGEPNVAPPGDPQLGPDYLGTYSFFAALRKPVIAAINGPCVGMALPVVCFCDLRFTAEDAFFMTAFAQRGLIAEWGSSWILPRLVGNGNALDMLLSSRRIYAKEALYMGLVNRVVPQDQLLSNAYDYIGELAKNCSPTSMAVMKRQVYLDWMKTLDDAQTTARALMDESFASADFKEGVQATIEKRPVKFHPLQIES